VLKLDESKGPEISITANINAPAFHHQSDPEPSHQQESPLSSSPVEDSLLPKRDQELSQEDSPTEKKVGSESEVSQSNEPTPIPSPNVSVHEEVITPSSITQEEKSASSSQDQENLSQQPKSPEPAETQISLESQQLPSIAVPLSHEPKPLTDSQLQQSQFATHIPEAVFDQSIAQQSTESTVESTGPSSSVPPSVPKDIPVISQEESTEPKTSKLEEKIVEHKQEAIDKSIHHKVPEISQLHEKEVEVSHHHHDANVAEIAQKITGNDQGQVKQTEVHPDQPSVYEEDQKLTESIASETQAPSPSPTSQTGPDSNLSPSPSPALEGTTQASSSSEPADAPTKDDGEEGEEEEEGNVNPSANVTSRKKNKRKKKKKN